MLSKASEYAIRALVYIQLKNIEGKRPGVLEVAREIEAPAPYTGKILQVLTKHKLLGSMKGRGGGFFFDEDGEELTLHLIIHFMEGDSGFTKCGFGLKNCSDAYPCPMHDKYIKVREALLHIAKTETIRSLSQKILDGQAVLNNMMK